MKYFADCHFHVMTMKEPNFAAFFNSFYDSASGLLSANAATNYIITPQMMKGDNFLNALTNTLSAFSRPIDETLMMMEDDLMGMYSSPRKAEYAPLLPYIHDGRFHIRGMEAEKLLMVPLIMDFSQDPEKMEKIYYKLPISDRLIPYTEATLEGIREYQRKRPDGLFDFYPFIGIDPGLHSMSFLEKILSEYVNTEPHFHSAIEKDEKPCFGIKIYPPLGFRPWPNDKEKLEKNRVLYSFCEKNGVPIITHADDQGFRGVSAEEAWANTDPAAWRTVLENYPSLKIDFAHFGKQYAIAPRSNVQSISARLKHHPDSPWFYSIISLMMDFDNVYADLSFTGCTPEFYNELQTFLHDQKEEKRKRITERILFGSDFSVNLFKVESYTEYFSIFEHSPFTDDEIEAFGSTNVIRFLGLSEKTGTPLRRGKPVKRLERAREMSRIIKPDSI